ncbi:MAG: hypothetical protein BWX68_02646 [Verrucomicrobia bacterium ADurb.Bin063]|nr:MAG: hypothetical protein BWX68_02646 [Verrucomicrobia bacterium ADurb.Bin063]
MTTVAVKLWPTFTLEGALMLTTVAPSTEPTIKAM